MAIPSPPAAVNHGVFSSSTSSTSYRPVISMRFHRFVPKACISNGDLHFDRSEFTSSIESPPVQLAQWNLGPKHISLLNLTACTVAISASWLFFSAIPTLLAMKKAANSLEKLMKVTAEELPDTMAAIRLSGMEISDLTTELSDLGQEITQGVRSSTRAVRVAEDRIRTITNPTNPTNPIVFVQGGESKMEPSVAKVARGVREGVSKGRASLRAVFSIIGFCRWGFGYLANKRKSLRLDP